MWSKMNQILNFTLINNYFLYVIDHNWLMKQCENQTKNYRWCKDYFLENCLRPGHTLWNWRCRVNWCSSRGNHQKTSFLHRCFQERSNTSHDWQGSKDFQNLSAWFAFESTREIFFQINYLQRLILWNYASFRLSLYSPLTEQAAADWV